MRAEHTEFLLEIGVEEIPAGMIPAALDFLADSLFQKLGNVHFPVNPLRKYATPRRLVVFLPEMPVMQPSRTEEILGPPAAIARVADGVWSKAALGFAAKQGAGADALLLIETPKGVYAGIRRLVPGSPARAILAQVLPDLIRAIPFPKTMVWREDKFRFVRPIRSLLALAGGEVIPFELAGVESGNCTFGHRFLGQPRIAVTGLDDYLRKLEENGVMLDPDRRRQKIETEIQAHETATGLRLVPDPALLDEVVFLHEWPTVIRGQFDRRFLDIPEEVPKTVMRKHQKYFSLHDAGGHLAPAFLAVINLDADSDGRIRQGHERVLKARLVDAEFFWNGDRKIRLTDRVASLANVLFQEQLGSYLEKTERIRLLVDFLAGILELSRETAKELDHAALLCKADLVTEMVKELTELQGIMGGLYARSEGYPEGVWRAIYDHYRPAGMDDAVPGSQPGDLLSIADKADTIAGMLGLGFVPTGSKDPFGLRRLAAGISRILLEKNLDLDLQPVFERALELVTPRLAGPPEAVWPALRELFEGRIRFFFQNAGYRYDEINAVMDRAVFRPVDGRQRLAALATIRQVSAFQSIFTAKKRIQNILDKQGRDRSGAFRPDLVQDAEERQLFELAERLDGPIAVAVDQLDYTLALRLIGEFARPVDLFFDKVLVMHPEPDVRNNRLLLLAMIGGIFDRVCDFSRFVIEGE